jgi:RNA polymerase sigma factor (sigma-70 family)
MTLDVAVRVRGGCEEDLIAAVRRGDDAAFAELYGMYRQPIHRFVQRRVGDHGRAEDVTQEIFISALRRLRSTDAAIAFKPWIYEIAKNACIDHARSAKRGREVPLEPDPEVVPAGGRRVPLSLVGAPYHQVQAKQQLADLCGAFGGLSDAHHQILVMRELEGRSYSEIAERLGMTPAMVESTLFRARRKLGQEYDQIASGQRCEQVRTVIDAGGASRRIGVRDSRTLRRHLAHCQPCRRHAYLAGFDHSRLESGDLAQRIAALLPFPFLRRAFGGDSSPLASNPFRMVVVEDVVRTVGASSPAILDASRAAVALVAVALAGAGVGLASQAGSATPSALPATPANLASAAPSAPGTRVPSAADGASAPWARDRTDAGFAPVLATSTAIVAPITPWLLSPTASHEGAPLPLRAPPTTAVAGVSVTRELGVSASTPLALTATGVLSATSPAAAGPPPASNQPGATNTNSGNHYATGQATGSTSVKLKSSQQTTGASDGISGTPTRRRTGNTWKSTTGSSGTQPGANARAGTPTPTSRSGAPGSANASSSAPAPTSPTASSATNGGPPSRSQAGSGGSSGSSPSAPASGSGAVAHTASAEDGSGTTAGDGATSDPTATVSIQTSAAIGASAQAGTLSSTDESSSTETVQGADTAGIQPARTGSADA